MAKEVLEEVEESTYEVIEEGLGEGDGESEEFKKIVKPSVKVYYAILLDTHNKDTKGTNSPFIGEVMEINEVDNIVIIHNISIKNDKYIFILAEGHLVLKSTKAQYSTQVPHTSQS